MTHRECQSSSFSLQRRREACRDHVRCAKGERTQYTYGRKGGEKTTDEASSLSASPVGKVSVLRASLTLQRRSHSLVT